MEEIYQVEKKCRIVVTGPESTGKTELACHLAKHFEGIFIPEYAREYIENLARPYTYKDVEAIAREQVQRRKATSIQKNKWIFFDTDLIITKVWFDEVFKKCPDWLLHKVEEPYMDLYLLCSPDIPWQHDPVRENGGERREYLFLKYKDELEKYNFSYSVISGKGKNRIENAFLSIQNFLIGS